MSLFINAREKRLIQAVEENNIEYVNELLSTRKSLNLNYKNRLGYTALSLALSLGNREEIIKLLLNNNANVNYKTKDNEPALHLAITKYNLDIIQLLIEHQVNINEQDRHGKTAVMRIIEQIKKYVIPNEVLNDSIIEFATASVYSNDTVMTETIDKNNQNKNKKHSEKTDEDKLFSKLAKRKTLKDESLFNDISLSSDFSWVDNDDSGSLEITENYLDSLSISLNKLAVNDLMNEILNEENVEVENTKDHTNSNEFDNTNSKSSSNLIGLRSPNPFNTFSIENEKSPLSSNSYSNTISYSNSNSISNFNSTSNSNSNSNSNPNMNKNNKNNDNNNYNINNIQDDYGENNTLSDVDETIKKNTIRTAQNNRITTNNQSYLDNSDQPSTPIEATVHKESSRGLSDVELSSRSPSDDHLNSHPQPREDEEEGEGTKNYHENDDLENDVEVELDNAGINEKLNSNSNSRNDSPTTFDNTSIDSITLHNIPSPSTTIHTLKESHHQDNHSSTEKLYQANLIESNTVAAYKDGFYDSNKLLKKKLKNRLSFPTTQLNQLNLNIHTISSIPSSKAKLSHILTPSKQKNDKPDSSLKKEEEKTLDSFGKREDSSPTDDPTTVNLSQTATPSNDDFSSHLNTPTDLDANPRFNPPVSSEDHLQRRSSISSSIITTTTIHDKNASNATIPTPSNTTPSSINSSIATTNLPKKSRFNSTSSTTHPSSESNTNLHSNTPSTPTDDLRNTSNSMTITDIVVNPPSDANTNTITEYIPPHQNNVSLRRHNTYSFENYSREVNVIIVSDDEEKEAKNPTPQNTAQSFSSSYSSSYSNSYSSSPSPSYSNSEFESLPLELKNQYRKGMYAKDFSNKSNINLNDIDTISFSESIIPYDNVSIDSYFINANNPDNKNNGKSPYRPESVYSTQGRNQYKKRYSAFALSTYDRSRLNGTPSTYTEEPYRWAESLRRSSTYTTDLSRRKRHSLALPPSTIPESYLSEADKTESNRQKAKKFMAMLELLLWNDADPNIQDLEGRTSLIVACIYKLRQVVPILLEYGTSVNTRDYLGKTALMYSCEKQEDGIVKKLLDYHSNINFQDHNGLTALMIACKYDNEDIVSMLLESRARVNRQDKNGDTALTIASRYGCAKAMQLLLRYCANTDIKNKRGETALIIACRHVNEEIIRLLMKKTIDMDIQDRNGNTALMYICQKKYEYVTLVQDFFKKQTMDVNVKNKAGNSALHIAAFNNHQEIVKLLLLHHADINMRNGEGNTALMWVASLPHREEMTQLLLNFSYWYVVPKNVIKVLQLRKKQKLREKQCQDLLLPNSFIDVDAVNNDGDSALIIASRSALPRIVHLLLRHHANCDIQNGRLETAIVKAIKSMSKSSDPHRIEMYQQVIKLLILYNANTHIKDYKKRDFVYYARSNKPFMQIMRTFSKSTKSSSTNHQLPYYRY